MLENFYQYKFEIAKVCKMEQIDLFIDDSIANCNKVRQLGIETIKNKQCVDIHDRVTPLDFWVCILAFTFDLNFNVTCKIVKENNYIDILIDRFYYKDAITRERMETIRNIINEFINEKIKRIK